MYNSPRSGGTLASGPTVRSHVLLFYSQTFCNFFLSLRVAIKKRFFFFHFKGQINFICAAEIHWNPLTGPTEREKNVLP